MDNWTSQNNKSSSWHIAHFGAWRTDGRTKMFQEVFADLKIQRMQTTCTIQTIWTNSLPYGAFLQESFSCNKPFFAHHRQFRSPCNVYFVAHETSQPSWPGFSDWIQIPWKLVRSSLISNLLQKLCVKSGKVSTKERELSASENQRYVCCQQCEKKNKTCVLQMYLSFRIESMHWSERW